MNCTEARDNLSALLDGELDRETAAAVEAHLAGCEACRADRDSLRALVGTLHALPKHAAPEEIEREVVSMLERDQLLAKPEAPAPRRPWGRILAASAAAAAILAAVGIYFFGGHKPAGNTELARSEAHGSGGDRYFDRMKDNQPIDDTDGDGTPAKPAGPEEYSFRGRKGGATAATAPAAPPSSGSGLSGDALAKVTSSLDAATQTPSPVPAPTPMPAKPRDLSRDGVTDDDKEVSGGLGYHWDLSARPEVFQLEIASGDAIATRARITTIASSLNIRALRPGTIELADLDRKLAEDKKVKGLPERLEDAEGKQKSRRTAEDERLREVGSKVARTARTGDEYEATWRKLLDLLPDVEDEPSPERVLVLAVPEDQLPELVAKLHADQAAAEKDKGKSELGMLAPTNEVKPATRPPAPAATSPQPEGKSDTKLAKKAPDPIDELLDALDEAAKEDAEREKMAREPYGLEAARSGHKSGSQATKTKEDVAQDAIGSRKLPPAPAEAEKKRLDHETTLAQPTPTRDSSKQQASARRLVYLQIYLTQSLPAQAKPAKPAEATPATK